MPVIGGGYGRMPAFVGVYDDSREVGALYGGMLTATGAAGLGAPLLLAVSAEATGSYDLALYGTAGLMLVSAVIPLVIRPPKPPGRPRPLGSSFGA
jgi:MFS transporter, OFA family, oxalate/formate antiporter